MEDNIAIFDFLSARERHQEIEDEQLNFYYDRWMYLCDEASDTFGIIKFVKKKQRVYQLVICNDCTDGLYIIDTMAICRKYHEQKKKEIYHVYPIHLDLVIYIDRTKVKRELNAWRKMRAMEIITEEEQKFLQILKNTRIKGAPFVHGMTEISTFMDKAVLKIILEMNGERYDEKF